VGRAAAAAPGRGDGRPPRWLGAVAGLLGVPHSEWPPFVLALSYATLGVSVGLRFDLQAFRATRRLVLPFLLCTLGMIGGAAMMGGVLVALMGTDWFSAYLATTPGGINIAVILAFDSGANVTLVLGISLVRFLLVMLAGPPLVRWLMNLTGTAPVPRPPPSHRAS
ncbi:MAG: AbrB family transcriptional regulator, partial [Chloroflexaceae bacterium]|nr:AbrB family transcriptional regulator [Chloroflexaceae bacterium]